MGVPVKTYKLLRVMFTLDEIRITGFGVDSVAEFERPSDIIEDDVTADGQVVVSYTNDNRMYVTITLLETSLAYKQLADKFNVQNAQDTLLPMKFLMIDLTNGDRVGEQFAVFKKMPVPTKGRKASERQFQILLPNAGENAIFGASITI